MQVLAMISKQVELIISIDGGISPILRMLRRRNFLSLSCNPWHRRRKNWMLRLGELRPSPVNLQFVDRSLAYPRGIVEDVFLEMDKFIFPIDFIVLDDDGKQDALQKYPI